MTASPNQPNILSEYGNLQLPSSQVVLIYTEWNADIVAELKKGAVKILSRFPQIKIIEIQVPGSVEIPFAVNQYHLQKGADAYIALGCVIKGETPHFEYVCNMLTQGITHLNLTINSPVIFGVLTVHQVLEAIERLGGSHGHKGEEAAITALKMIAFNNSLKP